jgi:HPt (histidine-containing phosphotransfer) domain-containing protein
MSTQDNAVDPEVLAGLRELDDGEGGVLKQLVEMFLNSTPGRIALLKAAVNAKNLKSLNSEAHSLKSSCGNLGAHRMAELCQALEHSISPDAIDELTRLLRDLDGEYERVRVELLVKVAD